MIDPHYYSQVALLLRILPESKILQNTKFRSMN